MGMTRTVRYSAAPPAWADIARTLGDQGYAVQIRMINGELAFPDEVPSEPWQELRLGTPAGMVTLRRGPNRIECVVWGNADAGLLQAWNGLAWACAVAGEGVIETDTGPRTPVEFRQTADLPDALRG